jgi:hypothetical protein
VSAGTPALSGRSPQSVVCAAAGAAANIIDRKVGNPAEVHRTIHIIRHLPGPRVRINPPHERRESTSGWMKEFQTMIQARPAGV